MEGARLFLAFITRLAVLNSLCTPENSIAFRGSKIACFLCSPYSFEVLAGKRSFVKVASAYYNPIRLTHFVYVLPVEELCLVVLRNGFDVDCRRNRLSHPESQLPLSRSEAFVLTHFQQLVHGLLVLLEGGAEGPRLAEAVDDLESVDKGELILVNEIDYPVLHDKDHQREESTVFFSVQLERCLLRNQLVEGEAEVLNQLNIFAHSEGYDLLQDGEFVVELSDARVDEFGGHLVLLVFQITHQVCRWSLELASAELVATVLV